MADERLAQLLNDLVHGGEPVSFYDAYRCVQLARRSRELGDALVHRMVELHDAPHLTLGGKDVLADFLKGYAQKLGQERALASRVIRQKDNGKVVRAKAGSRLLLGLADPVGEFKPVSQTGPLELRVRTPAQKSTDGAEYELVLGRPGFAILEMASGKRSFVLRVVVE